METSLAVVIGCAGREDLLLPCLQSIKDGCAGNDTVPYIIADGEWSPSDDVHTLVAALDGVIFEHGEQRGISRTWNHGISEALADGYRLINVINDDTILARGFDERIIRFMHSRPDVMLCSQPDRLTAATLWPGATPDLHQEHLPIDQRWSRARWDTATPVDTLYPGGFQAFAESIAKCDPAWVPSSMNGASFVLRKQTVEDLGLFDEGFTPPGQFEDCDYWIRALLKYGPYRMGTYAGGFLHHWRTATLSIMDRSETEKAVVENKAKFWSKWAQHKDVVEWFEKANATPASGAFWPAMPETLRPFSISSTGA